MFLLQSLLAIGLFMAGTLTVLMLSGSVMRLAAEAHYRAAASLLATRLAAQLRLGPHDYPTLSARYGAQGADYVSFTDAVAQALPGVSANPPVVTIDADRNVVITVRWQAPGDITSHQYVAATRIVD